MALSNAVVTFNIADLIGANFDARRTKCWITTNVANDTVIDTTGQKIRLGSGNVTVNDDGTGALTVWTPGAGANPSTWQTYIHFDYPDRNANNANGRSVRTFGPFTITGNADLSALVTEQEVPPEYVGAVVAQLEAIRDEAEAYRDQAHDISGISTPDSLVKTLIQTPGTDTANALSTSFVQHLSPSGGDDAAAIQAALNAANTAGGGVVVLSAGIFLTSATLTIGSNTTLVGMGRWATILRLLPGVGGTGRTLIENKEFATRPDYNTTGSGNFNITVSRMTLDGKRASLSGTPGQGCHGIEMHMVGAVILDELVVTGTFRSGIIINGEQKPLSRVVALSHLEIVNTGQSGIWIANGQRAVTWTDVNVHDCVGDTSGDLYYAAVVIDASEQIVNGLVAYGNSGTGIAIRNVFACTLDKMQANRNGRHGIFVLGFTDSQGSNWEALCNGDATANTYSDIYLSGDQYGTGYGVSSGVTVTNVRCGRTNASTNWKSPHNGTPQQAYALYIEDTLGVSGNDVRLVGVHAIAGTSGAVRYPATRGGIVLSSGRESDENAPSTAFVIASASAKTTSGTFGTTGFASGTVCNNLRQSDGTQNAYVEWDIALAAGTYKLDLFHQAATNCGIYTVAIDGVSVGTVDGYAAATAQAQGTISSAVVPTSGRHAVRVTMATKNASSSAYRGQLSLLTMARTGA